MFAQFRDVEQQIAGRAAVCDLAELRLDAVRAHGVVGLLGVLTVVGQVVVDAVLPAPQLFRQSAHDAVASIVPDQDDVLGKIELAGLVVRQHLAVQGKVKYRCAVRFHEAFGQRYLIANRADKHPVFLVLRGAFGEPIGRVCSAAKPDRPNDVQILVFLDSGLPVGLDALAVGGPVVVALDSPLLGEAESLVAEGVRQQDVVVMGGIDQAPVAGELLHRKGAIRPGKGRYLVQTQAQGSLEEAFVPDRVNGAAGVLRVAVAVQGFGQRVLVVMEQAPILESWLTGLVVDGFRPQHLDARRLIAGPVM